MKQLSFLLTFVVVGFSALTQTSYECHTEIPDSVRSQFEWGTECNYLDEFLVENIENEKIVRVNFHVVQDENGNNNFTVNDTAMMRDIFEIGVNQNRYIINPPPYGPIARCS